MNAGACRWGAAWLFSSVVAVSACTPFSNSDRLVAVTVVGNGVGFVVSTPAGLNCPGTCVLDSRGAEVTLEGSPAVSGTTFVGWSGACSGLEPCRLTPKSNVEVIAAFALRNSLVVTRVGKGTGAVRSEPEGIDCGPDCAELFSTGTEVTLIATPSPDSNFQGWSGACEGVDACVVSAAQAQLVTARFDRRQVTLTVTKTGAGSGRVTSGPAGIDCGSECSAPFDARTSVSLRATADPGSSFIGFSGACTGSFCSLTLAGDATVTANFAPMTTPLALSPATATVRPGGTLLFTATGGVQPYRFSAQGGSIDQTNGLFVAHFVAGTATVTVVDALGVAASAVVTVSIPPSPVPLRLTPADVVLAAGERVHFTVTGGTPPYTFAVISGQGLIDPHGNYNPAGFAGSAVVMVRDTGIGAATASITIAGDLFLGRFKTSLPGASEVAAGDWNGDGAPDLAVLSDRDGGLAVTLSGLGNGLFGAETSYRVSAGAGSMTSGDWNEDGKTDLAVASTTSGAVGILFGLTDGGFTAIANVASLVTPLDAITADWNRDGHDDLAIASGQGGGISLLLGSGDGSFQVTAIGPAATTVLSLASGDWNRDGLPDLAATTATGALRISLGAGDGTFAAGANYPLTTAAFSIAAGDLNGDGKTDLAMIKSVSGEVSVLVGSGDGTFLARPGFLLGNATSLVMGDWNGDGALDLAVTISEPGDTSVVVLLLGDGADSFEPPTRNSVAPGPASLVSADWNRDGRPDLAVASRSGNTLAVLENVARRPSGQLFPQTRWVGSSPTQAIAGDWNLDGQPDLAIANANDVVFNWGVGNGSFLPAQTHFASSGVVSMVTADWNRDGRPDLAVTNGQVEVLLGGAGGLILDGGTSAAGTSPTGLTVGDWNHDGKPDLVTANLLSNDLSVLLGVGDGTFLPSSSVDAGLNPIAVTSGDWNRDGKADLAVANQNGGTVSVLLGFGDGTFRAAVSAALVGGGSLSSITTGDWNLDGRPDLAVGNSSLNEVQLLLGGGDGSFFASRRLPVGALPVKVISGDWNVDGRVDLAVVNNGGNSLTLIYGTTASAMFEAPVTFALPGAPTGLTSGDWNGDGRPDLVASLPASNQVSVFSSGP